MSMPARRTACRGSRCDTLTPAARIPSGKSAKCTTPRTHLIPLVLQAARSGTPVQIYGSDYDTADGTCIRDYVHVADLADAHVYALAYLLSGGVSCALNLANARGYSVKEVITTAERVCARKIPVIYANRRAGDPPQLIGSAERARALLAWEPAKSELDVQVLDTWNWMLTRN